MTETDSIEIQKLYQQKICGWNIGDAVKFAEPYSDDADFIGFDGTYLEGKQQIIMFHAIVFDKFVRGTRLVGKVKHIRFPIPTVAIVVGISGTIERGHDCINPERNSIHTIVAIKATECGNFPLFRHKSPVHWEILKK